MIIIIKIENPTVDEILSFQFAAYLNVSFRHCRIGYWRKQTKIQNVSIDNEDAGHKTKMALSMCDKTLTSLLTEISDSPIIVKTIESLSTQEKQILSLHILERYSLTEISELINMKHKKIYNIFSNIKDKFKGSGVVGF